MINHTGYELKIKEALTIKPDDFKITVKPRKTAAINVQRKEQADIKAETKPKETKPKHGIPLLVLYGSNLGTAEGIAGELAAQGRQMGFTAETAPLDDYIGKLPEEGAVVIVTASYNGAPPDNAAGFVEWLKELEEGQLKGVSYAVFGCGNRSWASTYQRIPRLIDDMMKAKGASRLTAIGEGDAADDFESHRESWENRFWKETMDAFDINEIAQKEDRPHYRLLFSVKRRKRRLLKHMARLKGLC